MACQSGGQSGTRWSWRPPCERPCSTKFPTVDPRNVGARRRAPRPNATRLTRSIATHTVRKRRAHDVAAVGATVPSRSGHGTWPNARPRAVGSRARIIDLGLIDTAEITAAPARSCPTIDGRGGSSRHSAADHRRARQIAAAKRASGPDRSARSSCTGAAARRSRDVERDACARGKRDWGVFDVETWGISMRRGGRVRQTSALQPHRRGSGGAAESARAGIPSWPIADRRARSYTQCCAARQAPRHCRQILACGQGVIAIPKASSIDHTRENRRALLISLTGTISTSSTRRSRRRRGRRRSRCCDEGSLIPAQV